MSAAKSPRSKPYERFLRPERLRRTTVPGRSLSTEAVSDRGRVLFSTAWRRLQQKAQVFPLEDNAAVRSRLTHSLEVAHIGVLIATEVIEQAQALRLLAPWGLRGRESAFRSIVETACLSHDIGNPPFGHFGESAIQTWSTENLPKLIEPLKKRSAKAHSHFERFLAPDFQHFDGNAQGIRILMLLQWNADDLGLNLTASQLAASLKYTRAPHEPAGEGAAKKPGYFASESAQVQRIRSHLGLRTDQRFPLSYIMEAADDIAYCISDIEDAIEKDLITTDYFRKQVLEGWRLESASLPKKDRSFLPDLIKAAWSSKHKLPAKNIDFFDFKTTLNRALTQGAATAYVQHHGQIVDGTASALLDLSALYRIALEVLKGFARRFIFTKPEAEHMELAGHEVVRGLLDHLRPLLTMSRPNFEGLKKARLEGVKRPKGLDLEWRLFGLLPSKHLLAYTHTADCHGPGLTPRSDENELFARFHLVTDFVSGMTDRYALELFQLLNGIRVQ